MKKTLPIIVLILVAGIVVADTTKQLWKQRGEGAKLTATTTPQVFDVQAGNSSLFTFGKVVVIGSETVYVMKNCTTNNFALTNAMPVEPGFPLPLYSDGGRIWSVCYATSNSTSAFTLTLQ